MESALTLIAFLIAQSPPEVPPRFIAPIETMKDVQGDIVYTDRNSPYFLIVKDGKFYIGHPNSEGGAPEEDVPYTWGKVEDCSTADYTCRRLGAQVFARPKGNLKTLSYVGQTVLSAWSTGRGGWWGAGARCTELARGAGTRPQSADRPSLTYQYEVNASGVVVRILVTYWRTSGSTPIIHELRLETAHGIHL